MKNTTLYRFSFIPVFLISFLAIAQIGGGGGIGGFPTRDLTLSGTLDSANVTATGAVQAEQITSTDDIDYNGVLTNDYVDNTTFGEYLRFQTSDYATDGSALFIQKSSVEDDWLLGTTLTGGGGIQLRFDADLDSLTTDDSFLSTATITAEQLTSTDDIDYNGILTNNYLDNTSFGFYLRYETSDFATDGSAFFIQKASPADNWLIGATETEGNTAIILFEAGTETITLGNEASTTIQGPGGSTIWQSDNDGAGSGLDADRVGGGNSTKITTCSVANNFSSISSDSIQTDTLTCTGVVDNTGVCLVSGVFSNITFNCSPSSSDEIVLRANNQTSGSVDPPNRTYSIVVIDI